MPIKTFRGLIADGGQDTIVLHTNDGSVGYRIVKLQIFPYELSVADQESIVKIYKVKQTTFDSKVDMSDNTLLGMASWTSGTNADNDPEDSTIIFDQEIFNQDIYISHVERKDVAAINYYLELEQVKLDLSENTVATLKDIRNVKTQGF
tara:strand:+ start:56 stop:502 length:447 start_codon:yes stop_codon:yes gene_type:complete